MNEEAELLVVEDHFDIKSRGLVLLPDFDVPVGWKNRSEPVVVVTPDGKREELVAWFSAAHFNIRDPNVGANRRWRVCVTMPSASKIAVPIGSKLYGSSELKASLIGKTNA